MNGEKTKEQWQIELLGIRGSMAVTPREYQEFGSDTLCVRVKIGKTTIYLDAGSGIMYGEAGEENHVLIGHPHLDHLLGLCKWPALADPAKKMTIYMARHGGESCDEILHKLYGPPFWPIHLEDVSKNLEYVTIDGDFQLGDVSVRILSGNHPGGVTHYRLTDGVRSLTYAVDCELTKEAAEALCHFAEGSDLLFCDGQLLDDEAKEKRGWGHSTMSEAARLGAACHAKHTVLVHFDPSSTDERLRREEQRIKKQYPNCSFGRQGDILYL